MNESPSPRIGWAHRVWFAVTFLFGIAVMFALPPFQVNDEPSHWRRAWTVAEAQVYCKTIPEVVDELMPTIKFEWNHHKQRVARWDYIKAGLEYRGYNIPVAVNSTSCGYFPLSYIPSAVAARLVAFNRHSRPRVGGMMRAFYAGRFMNWLVVSLGVFWLLWKVPWARSLTLFFYSIPEVLQQSVAYGTDGYLFVLCFGLIIVLFKPARWRWVACIALCTALMSVTKPIYVPLSLLAAPAVLTLIAAKRWGWQAWTALVSLLLPFPIYRAWASSVPPMSGGGGSPGWIRPADQMALLHEHPGRLVLIMWRQLWQTLFDDQFMHGSWTSIFGAFAWSEFTMSKVGHYCLLVALVVALAADWGAPAMPPQVGPPLESRWGARLQKLAWASAVVAPILVCCLVVLAMYIFFTHVGSGIVTGVQGRYYLVSLLLLAMMGLYKLKRRWPPHQSVRLSAPYFVWAAAFFCAWADWKAVEAIKEFFWVTGP